MPGKTLWLLISLISLLDAARPATSRRAREVRSFARVLSEEWAKRGESDLAWDGVLGKGLLLAVSAAMTPAAAVVANVGRIDLPGELGPAGPLGEELDLDAPPLTSAKANVTRLTVDGLESLAPFSIAAADAGHVEGSASFGGLQMRMELDIQLQLPFGRSRATKLALLSEVRNVTTAVTLRCGLRKDRLVRSVVHGGELGPGAVRLAVHSVRVNLGGRLDVRVERADAGADAEGGAGAVWRVLNGVLQAALREQVERRVEEAIHEAIQELIDSWGGGAAADGAADGADGSCEQGVGDEAAAADDDQAPPETE